LNNIYKEARINRVGRILVNEDPKDAKFSNMLTGDGPDDFDHIDLGKVQMLYFTLLISVIYSIMLAQNFMNLMNLSDIFPALDSTNSLIVLLGVSNGGYLIKKAT
jgi:hypothetical protein